MHVITGENYNEAADAVRDILMMYVDMASSYQGFGHASDVYVRFDPLKFVDAETDGKAHYVDLELLRAGSALAILYFFYDLWCEEQRLSGEHTQRHELALNEGRLRAFPDIERVIREAISRGFMPLENQWFEEAVVPIYRKYVLGFFRRLSASDRSSKLSLRPVINVWPNIRYWVALCASLFLAVGAVSALGMGGPREAAGWTAFTLYLGAPILIWWTRWSRGASWLQYLVLILIPLTVATST